jgi:pimeloyl-ACP methyl ester carboxylesterase
VTASAVAAAVHSWPLRFDVSAAVPFPGATVGGWVCAPATLDRDAPVIVFACLAGGGCSAGYWDAVADDVPDASMARYVATRSCVVVALDHLGIGRSSPIDDIYRVTPTIAAAAQDHALRRAITGLRAGTLALGMPAVPDVVPIGVGHSMGGMILGVQQARHRTFDAVVVLGHGGDGMPEALTAEEAAIDVEQPLVAIETDVAACARLRFAPNTTVERRGSRAASFLLADVPDGLRRAFEAQRVPLLYSSGLVSMIPGATDDAKRAIDVPVFLAFGDHDLSSDYFGNMARYCSSRDVTLFVLPDAAHCHNHAVTRTLLWDRLVAWARGVSQISRRATSSP